MIIFYYLLFLTFSHFIAIQTRKVNFNTLFCGLIGYCGSVKADKNALKIVAIYNDSRGGDSCGIYTNKEVFYGVKTAAKFKDYFSNFKFPEGGREDYTYIMHSRKASSGFVKNSSNAHPFLLADADGKPTFVGAHNGTLRNWITLCRNRDISVVDIDVDSLGLLACIHKDKNFKVLSEYEGGAALLFKDTSSNNQLYAFKGGGGGYEERPLFYYQRVNTRGKVTGVYISSIEDSLLAIGAEPEQVISFKNNELISFKDGYVESSKIIARSGALNTSAPVTYNPSSASAASADRLDYKKKTASNRRQYPAPKKVKNIFHEELSHPFYKNKTVYFQKFRFFRNGCLLQGGAILNKLTNKDVWSNITTEEEMEQKWNNLEKTDDCDRSNCLKGWFHNGVYFKEYKDFLFAKVSCIELTKQGSICIGHRIEEFNPTHPVISLTKLKGKKKKSYSAVNNVYFKIKGKKDYTYTNDFTPFTYKVRNGAIFELIDKEKEEIRKNKPNILDAYDSLEDIDNISELEAFGEIVVDYYDDAMSLLKNFYDLREDEDVSFIYNKIYQFVYIIYSRDIVTPDEEDLDFLILLDESFKLQKTNVNK